MELASIAPEDLWQLVTSGELLLSAPQALWLFIPVVGIVLWQLISRTQRVLVVLLRGLILALLVLALCAPVQEEESTREHFTALVDVSGSISSEALSQMAERLADFTAQDRGMTLLPFAAAPVARPIEIADKVSARQILNHLQAQDSVVARDNTNVAAALDAAALRNAGSPILLLSDGQTTAGDLPESTRKLRQLGRGVYPLLLDESLFLQSQLEIASLFAPVTANAGDIISVYSSVRNTLNEERTAVVEFWLDKKKLKEQRVTVPAGNEERIVIETPKLEGGLQRIRAVLRNEDGTNTTRHRWISVKERSKLLLIHGSNDDRSQLQELVQLKGYTAEHIVAVGNAAIPDQFSSYSAIVLNNAARHQLPQSFLPALENFARNGGGVLLVGGDRSFGLGDYINSPLEKLSPLKFVPPQTQKKRLRVALALVLDKSGSMAQQDRMNAAKRAVVTSIDSMKDEDYVTVIGFDDAPFVIMSIMTIDRARADVDKRLRNLTAAGQTNLLPAMSAARQLLARADAGRKHMIILSDGQFPMSTDSYVNEINQLKRDGVTISTIALGSEADLPFLKFLSQTGGGSFHHTLDSSRLPNIFVEDIKVATGEESMAERDLFPVGVGPGGLQSTTVNRYPPLRGFVETLPKKGATLELITRRTKGVFPILASWTYGKGKVAAFTSDANGRWSQPWLRWPQFHSFWGNVFDWIRSGETGRSGDIDFDLRYSIVEGSLSFELLVYDEKLRNSAPPAIQASLIEPSNEKSVPTFSSVAPGRFEAAIPGAKPGDYRLSVRYGAVELPPVGITLHDDSFGEQAGKGIDRATLTRLASQTGGSLQPRPDTLPVSAATERSSQPLYSILLILAFIGVLAEALLRERVLRGKD